MRQLDRGPRESEPSEPLRFAGCLLFADHLDELSCAAIDRLR